MMRKFGFEKEKRRTGVLSSTRGKWLWVTKISLLAFSVSLFLSLLSSLVLERSGLIVAIFLLLIFLSLNVLSDMIGLAITSCQMESLKKIDNLEVQKKCLMLVRNSDKVSSILCDVIGDICGILCGVSGTIVTAYCVVKIEIISLEIFVGAGVSAIIAGLTVLFKAISKNYAVKNSEKIVKKVGAFLCLKKRKSKLKQEKFSNDKK
ncbi:MAG: hypothetical protein ACI4L7_03955 [Christensenellales bacterium]